MGNYKGRKYASLVPWIRKQGYQHVLLRGSSHSSNVVQLALRLGREGIRASYRLEGREGPPVGNGLLSRLILGNDFLDSAESVKVDWEVPEGGNCQASLAGSLGVAGSVVHNILDQRAIPRDLYIDSGTGFTAAALLLGLGFFELPVRVRVVTMTRQSSEDIQNLLDDLSSEYGRLFQAPPRPLDYEVLSPPVGRSYGSTPASVFAEIREMAQDESLLVDPLYTAKLSLAYKQCREIGRGAMMFVSGGQTELLGFQHPLAAWLDNHTDS